MLLNLALVTAMELLKLDPPGKLLSVVNHLETDEKIVATLLQTGLAECFLSYRDFTLIHLLKSPGLLSNTYFEASENCQILKNRRD